MLQFALVKNEILGDGNLPITELITITIATTTYPEKNLEFPKWGDFF